MTERANRDIFQTAKVFVLVQLVIKNKTVGIERLKGRDKFQ